MEHIIKAELGYIEEPLTTPFGFKGGTLSGLWQVVVRLTTDNGQSGMGLGVQSVLWSDPKTFCSMSEHEGNKRMLDITRRALEMLKGAIYTDPNKLIKELIPELTAYAQVLLGRNDVPRTFILNALVPVDMALWQLLSHMQHSSSFDRVVGSFCPALCAHETTLGNIPLISYNTSEQAIRALLMDGAFLLKIKIGSNPGGKNDPDTMLRWDVERLREIHQLANTVDTEYTDCGCPLYYLDANGRYPTKELLKRFLDEAEKMGALSRIALFEEPFPQEARINLRDLPICAVGDESAHSAEDVQLLINELGYSAIALKPIAKTLSITLDMVDEVRSSGAMCFCADLTVPPAMLDWNMSVAARLPRLKGLKAGVVESNGKQNYPDWERMDSMCTVPHAPWRKQQHGVYVLSEAFYEANGLFEPLVRYAPYLKAL